jgi:hypothetical protein
LFFCCFYQNQGSSFFESFFHSFLLYTALLLTVFYQHAFFLYGCSCSRHSRKIAESFANSSTWFAVHGSPAAVFALHLYLHVLYFYMEVFFCSSSRLMVSSPKNSPFLTLSTLDKSISGLTDLKSPIFTRRSYLLLTAGILFLSTEIWH